MAPNSALAFMIASSGVASWKNRVMQLIRRAIRSWRDLAGLDNARRVDQAAVDNAVRLIAMPA